MGPENRHFTFAPPQRKVLIPKRPSKRCFARQFVKSVTSVPLKKHISVQPHTLELSTEQLLQAEALANILPLHLRRSESPMPQYLETPPPSPEPMLLDPLPSPTNTLHSAQEPLPSIEKDDWESAAARVIAQKKLTLNDTWSAYTWKNKTSIHVRLKLLKDDGYDITSLQGKGLSSTAVTEALIAHIGTCKQNLEAVAIPAVLSEREGGAGDIEDAEQRAECEENASSSAQNPLGDGNDAIGTDNQVDPLTDVEYMARNSMIPKKRKHDHWDEIDDIEPPWQPGMQRCDCGPPPKRLRVMDKVMTKREMKLEAFRLFFRTIDREIFSISRPLHQNFTVIPFESRSRVFFPPVGCGAMPRPRADVTIGTRGVGFIIDEIKKLYQKYNSHNTYAIFDMDMMEENGKTAAEIANTAHTIYIAEDNNGGVDMQGTAYALAGLMRRLRGNELINNVEWMFDGLEVVPRSKIIWSLSDKTNKALAKIEKLLLAGAAEGQVFVAVEQKYNGDRLKFQYNPEDIDSEEDKVYY